MAGPDGISGNPGANIPSIPVQGAIGGPTDPQRNTASLTDVLATVGASLTADKSIAGLKKLSVFIATIQQYFEDQRATLEKGLEQLPPPTPEEIAKEQYLEKKEKGEI